MKILMIILVIHTFKIWGAPIPTRFRYEFNYGKSSSNYIEIRDSVLIKNRNIRQESNFGDLQITYWAKPKMFDFNFGSRMMGFSAKSDGAENEIYTLNYTWLNAGFHFPILYDFLWGKIVAEAFYADMNSQDGFGFRNLTGGSIYPAVEYFSHGTDMFFSASPFLRLPLLTGDNVWREFAYGIKLKFPVVRGKRRFPLYAYQTAFVIRLMYSKLELAIRKSGYLPVDAIHSWSGLSVGFEF